MLKLQPPYHYAKKLIPAFVFLGLSVLPAFGADWKALTDEAVSLAPAAVATLESRGKKSEQDVYILTLIYYRQYSHAGLKKLFNDCEKTLPDSAAIKLLQGIILMREHQHRPSRAVLDAVLKTHPDFYPALFVLGHQCYLQKDYKQAYVLARQLLDRKKELSRYHLTASLVLAAGARGFTAPRNWLRAIPVYFEVTGYFRDAKKIMPESAEVLYGLGCFHLLTPAFVGGDLDLAISMLEKSRRLTPLNTQVYVRLAQAYRAKKDEAAYRKNIARAVELDPFDEMLVDYLSGEKTFLDVP